MYKNIFFDFDGTLFNTSDEIIDCFKWTIKEIGRDKIIEKVNKNIIGPSADKIFKNLFPEETDKFINKATLLFRQKYVKDGIFKAKPFRGTKEMLLELNDVGKKMGIISNKPKAYILRILNNFNLTNVFDYIIASELNRKGFNKAEELKKLINKFSLTNSECILVGDRIDDIIAGKINKVATVGIFYGFGSKKELIDSKADYTCNNVIDLKKILVK